MESGLNHYESGTRKEYGLRLQETRVQFSAHTLCGSRPSVTLAPGCLMPLASMAPARIGTDSPTDEHTRSQGEAKVCVTLCFLEG